MRSTSQRKKKRRERESRSRNVWRVKERGGVKRRDVEQRSMSDVNAARCFITVISFNKSCSREPRQFQGKIDF